MEYDEKNVILKMNGITKRFPGTLALDHAQLTCEKGKVTVLLGENGAGKSTLVKIIAGIYQKDEGTMWYDGQEVNLTNVNEGMEKGISMIHQELNLLPERTVAQNIYIGHEPVKAGRLGVVDNKKMAEDSRKLLESLGVDIDPNTLIKNLSIAQQQMVEVVKALSKNIKLLIMDEPTSSLTNTEIDKLFEIVNRLKEEGKSIIYISHRMDEIQRVGDYVVIMRDGKYIDTLDAKTADMDHMISLMVGREINNLYQREYQKQGDMLFETKDLTGLRFKNVNIKVHAGEIVSLAGLIGAGRTEVAKAVFGADPIVSGSFTLLGKTYKRMSPSRSIDAGMGYLPEDRKGEGLVLEMSISENIVEASLKKLFPRGFIHSKKESEVGEKYRGELRIASPSAEKLVGELSGGNMQKVVIGKWLETESRFLIFDEPTRGIDIGAKAEIYKLMDSLVKQGYGILMISSELNEVIGISDRVYVMRDGLVTGELGKDELNQERIMQFAIGGAK